jgi:hypothetical protein
MTLVSKVLALITFLVTIIPIVVFGRFENEFLRLNIIFSSLIFSYFANEHYLIRLIVTKLLVKNICVYLGHASAVFCDSSPGLPLYEGIHNAVGLLLKK